MLSEAKRLYDLGFAVHLLKEKSKAPVKSGWSGPTRDDFSLIKKAYRKGLGLGVRLGEPSNLGDGYLCVIDVDLKSPDPRHREEAFAVIDEKFPGLRESAPVVKTGRGYHFYARTLEPLKSGKIKTSNEEVKVHSPTSEINRRQSEKLSVDELKAGYRMKSAWEVEFMSVGKQVVLPPTLHPDTGKPYGWLKRLKTCTSIPFIRLDGVERVREKGRPIGAQIIQDFEPVEVDLSRLSDRLREMITIGEGVSDQSADAFGVCIAMLKSKYSDQEILTVLTDRENSLGNIGYEHRKTNSRRAAAAWVRDYCIRKAKEEIDATRTFEEEVEIAPEVESPQTQVTELTEPEDWKSKLTRTKKGEGPPYPSLENVILILSNAVSPQIFKRDTFSFRDAYGVDTPWGGKKNESLTDDEIAKIILWIGQRYRFEPSERVISNAMTVIACQNAYDPVYDWLEGLPEWDGVARLDGWLLKNFEAEGNTTYLAEVFRKWIVAMVMRIYRPGAKFDWMPIFEGIQGIGKSSFGRLLVGDRYFLDWLPNLADKDAALSLQGIWNVELGELATLGRSELKSVKAFLTRTVDKVRPPYGKRWLESPRRCVFFGTTNVDKYLRDDTGNRRFKPIEVGKLKFSVLKKERDQLFAEAVFLFKNEFETEKSLDEFSPEAKVYELQIQEEKKVEDESVLIVDELKKRFENPESFYQELEPKGFAINDLLGDPSFMPHLKRDGRAPGLVAKALKIMNFEKVKIHGNHRWRLKKHA